MPRLLSQKVTIVIPSFNGLQLLQKLMPYLEKFAENQQIVVVDNGSTDNSIKWLNENFPLVETISLGQNFGVTGAINAGVKKAKYTWLLLLNNDCFLSPTTIQKLLETAHQNHWQAVSPLVKKPDGSLENAGYLIDMKIGKTVINNDPALDSTVSTPSNIFGLSMACLLVKKESFLQVGGLDESFHSYLEDVDFFIRMYREKKSYGLCPNSEAIHNHMATSKNMGLYKPTRDVLNWWRIIFKYHPFHSPVQMISLLLERGRNLGGWLKAFIAHISIQKAK